MKIYVLKHENIEKFPECWIENENLWFKERFVHGERIENVHALPIKYQVDNNYLLKDYLYCSKWFLISNKFASVLKVLTNEYQEFPSEIYAKNKLISSDFVSFIIIAIFPVLDPEKSEYRKYKFGTVMGLKRMVLSENRLNEIPQTIHIFRIKEVFPRIIVTEKGKQLIEDA